MGKFGKVWKVLDRGVGGNRPSGGALLVLEPGMGA